MVALIKFPSHAYYQAAKLVLKSLPNPFISLLVTVAPGSCAKKKKPQHNKNRSLRQVPFSSFLPGCYRTVDLAPEEFNLEGLIECLSGVYGQREVTGIVLERTGTEVF